LSTELLIASHLRLANEAVEVARARNRKSFAIEYRGCPIGRQVVFLQQCGQNLRSDHHHQYVGNLPVAEDRHPHGQDRPPQHGTNDQVRDLRLARFNDAIEHFAVDRARERFAERSVGVDQLLCFSVE